MKWNFKGRLMPAIGLLISVEATAQENDIFEEIIVTGSRIPRAGFETLQPATVLDNEEITLRGAGSLADILNEQSGFITPGVTPVGAQGIFTTGQSSINFLGLGAQRTLTLVNGQRFPAASSMTGLAVNLNNIPENLVQRVETIAIGGAPIYGTDAIAGTVNIILKEDFEGLEFSATKGLSPEFHDSDESRLEFTWGQELASGRGNITVAGMYASTEGMLRTDRPQTINTPGFAAPVDRASPFDLVLYDQLTLAIGDIDPYALKFGNRFGFNIFGNGIPLDLTNPAAGLIQFDEAGNIQPFIAGERTGSPIFKVGGDGIRLPEYAALNTDQERFNITLLSNYELTDTIHFRGELWWTHSEGTALINQPVYNDPSFGGLPGNNWGNVGEGPIPVLLENPFLPSATRDNLAATLNVVQDFNGDGLAEPTIDTDGDGVPDAVGFWRGGTLDRLTGNNQNTSETDLYRLALALDGNVEFAGEDFQWDVSLTLGRSESDYTRLGANTPNFEQAIRVVADADGNAVCQDASGGCVPLNVIGTPSPEAIDYVSDLISDKGVIEQRVLSANISGDLFELPAGGVGVAAGFAYREESIDFTPNHLARAGFDRFNPEPLKGEFDSTEIYIETVIPLLGGNLDTPLVKSLQFEGALRLVDNSVGGSDTTWTAGLRYQPIEDLEFRGNVTQAIRAPSLLEMFQNTTNVQSQAQDPCDVRFINAGDNPAARVANCTSAGIGQPFNSFVVNSTAPGTVSGNPDLDNEIADSSTVGIIFRPRFVSNLTASIDWIDIEVSGAIQNFSLGQILSACYDSLAFAREAVCGRVQRDVDGQVADFQAGYVNIARREVTGVQSAMSWFTTLGDFGDLGLNFNHMYTEKNTFTPGAGNAIDWAGTIGNAEHRANLSATWHAGDWTWYNQLRWLDSSVFTNENTVYSPASVPSWTVLNTTLGYAVTENLDVSLTVDNLFNRKSPFPAAGIDQGIRTYYSSILGRYARLKFKAHF